MKTFFSPTRFLCVALAGATLTSLPPRPAMSQQPAPAAAAPKPDALGFAGGTIDIDTPELTLRLVKSSQTVAALLPKGQGGFDFAPSDRLQKRLGNGFNHLGDISLRVRKGKAEAWRSLDTSAARAPVTPLPSGAQVLAAADLSPTLPANSPVRITRTWALDGGHLALRFEVRNISEQPVDIGALSIPMVFNNIISDRSLKEAHERCSFFDPYIGADAGYLQVTRLSGKGPALAVVPEGKTPFEGWRLLDEPERPNQTFEGTFAWMPHTVAYAHNEWREAEPWNVPTMATLAPGASRTYGVKLLLSPSIRGIEKTLADNARPVAVGVPGYVLPQDLDARLFLKYLRPVSKIRVEPEGALALSPVSGGARGGWRAYSVRARGWGRARVTISYDDGTQQVVSYYATKPAARAVADMGRFLTNEQWFVDANDPFGRSPSVMSYDREANAQVTQDNRAWIPGLGDEGGSSWLTAAMKEFVQPEPAEVAKMEEFVTQVLWGGLQFKDGPKKFGVRKTAFYYAPKELPGFEYNPSINWSGWESWNHEVSNDIGRGYNYPHVVAAYWAMYRVARNHPGMVKGHDWQWFLNQAYETMDFAFGRNAQGERNVGYVELGLMDGTAFLEVLQDVKREGWTEKAARLEALMKERAERWKGEEFPFGSEMAWDSTGQEEVYDWCKYFGYEDKAQVSLDSITGYMPTLPHWGYNGNARRYWDFIYGGKLRRIERQFHHYGSTLNAIPALTEYREHPEDLYLLRIGYGGTMGGLSNIDQDGFASAAFHSFPTTLKWDAYSGDYGPNFFGHAINAATYLVDHPDFGWVSFGGNVQQNGDWVSALPRDAARQRVYIAPRGLWLTLDAGTFESVSLNTRSGAVRVSLSPAGTYTPRARLRIEQPAKLAGVGAYELAGKATQNGAYEIALGKAATSIVLRAR